MPLKEAVALRIVAMRHGAKLTQRQMAERFGVTQTMVSHLEGGRRNISFDLVYRVSRALDASLSEFFDDRLFEKTGRSPSAKPAPKSSSLSAKNKRT